VWGNTRSGIQINADASLGGDGIITGAIVERNTIFGNGAGGGSALNMDGVQDSILVNNLLYDNHASGISLYKIDGAEGAKNNDVLNNTILQPSDGRWALNIQGGSTGNTARNNILLNQHSFRGSISISADSQAGFTNDYNAVKDRFSTMTIRASHRTMANGDRAGYAFVCRAVRGLIRQSSALRLSRAGSPAIDKGTALLAPAIDLAGALRPRGAGFDIGAYEHLPGDVNYDGAVNIFDINLVSFHWGETGPLGDANGDRAVNIFDINLVSASWTASALAVPEPGSVVLAAIATAGLIARCRRGRAR
jgi:hypothetical protein